MKKLLSISLLALSGIFSTNVAFAQCGKNDTILFLGSLRYNNVVMAESFLKNNCVSWDEKTKKMTFKQIKTVDEIKLIEKYNRGLNLESFKGEHSKDLLSSMLYESIYPRTENILAEEEKETQALLNKAGANNKFNYNWRQTTDDKDKLLDYLAKKNVENVKVNLDVVGNSVLNYMILANKPNLIKYSYTALGDKKIWIKPNSDGFFAIHFLFSPLLKNKNVATLNDVALKEIPVAYLLNAGQLKLGTGKTYDFFQYAELMKENNPDLYKKLKDKYQFEVKGINNAADVKKYINDKITFKDLLNKD